MIVRVISGIERLLEPMVTEKEKIHLEKLRAGNEESFRWLFNQNHGRVYGFCLKLTRFQPVAEEITSEVFFRLWQKRNIIDPSFPISNLLFKMTRDLVWNYLKKESRENLQQLQYALDLHASTAPSAESDLILKDYLSIAEGAILQMPEKRREVFLLHYESELTDKEIAHQLNIAESTVRVHLYKAILFLRNYLKSHPEMILLVLWALSQDHTTNRGL
jgi:RNA polymerase sigma-70 factor (ECF subfamily)